MTRKRWLIFAVAYAAMLAFGAARCYGEKPALKLKRAADGSLLLMPDLPAGTPYDWPEFGSGEGGKSWGICAWISNGRATAATYWFPYRLDGVTPSPTPDPRPEPGPGPNPQPGPQPMPEPDSAVDAIFLVHESADSTPQTAAVRDAKAWKDACEKRGIGWKISDDDTLAKVFPNIAAAARTNGLPAVVIVRKSRDKTTVDAPATPAAMLKLCEGLR